MAALLVDSWEIKDDGEEIDDVLDYYLTDAYWSVYSREPKDAVIVTELVREYIEGLAEI